MKRILLLFIAVSALFLASCGTPGYHRIPVSWAPGYENVPDCHPLIAIQGKSVTIKGVNVTTPAGVGVGGGEFSREDKALQNASDAAQQADQRFTRLCELLPSFANDKVAFYHARDEMFDLIRGTQQVATAVAAQTGQPAPAPAPAVPTVASDAAAGSGINPAKGVANLPASAVSAPAASPAPATSTAAIAQVKSAASNLEKIVHKKTPSRRLVQKKEKKAS